MRALVALIAFGLILASCEGPASSESEAAALVERSTPDKISSPGTVTLTASALDDVGGNAHYDPLLGAPRCAEVSDRCDTGELLEGRGSVGPEKNAPNTLDTCTDGSDGTYRADESLERLRVVREDGTALAVGKRVRIEADVWVYHATYDKLDLYYAADATQPSWTYLTTLVPWGHGAQTLSTEYILPAGGLQAVRGRFRYGGSPSACSTGTYDDHDDVVFPVAQEQDSQPPTVSISSPVSGEVVSSEIKVTISASDNFGVTSVALYEGAALIGTDTRAPFDLPWATRRGPNGSYTLTARAFDAAGNTVSSAPVTVTVDNDYTAPTVSIAHPTQGAILVGGVQLEVNATDNKQVIRVEYFTGARRIGTSSSSPFTLSWNTLSEPVGEHVLTARAYDRGGNTATSEQVVVTVERDTVAPTVAITAPSTGATVTGSLTISANASDQLGVQKVEFYVDGTLIATDGSSPYSTSWDSRSVPNGSHTLTARAYDAANNQGVSAPVTVTVDNDSTPPTVTLTSPAEGAALAGLVSLSVDASDDKSLHRVEFFVDGARVATSTAAPYTVSWDSTTVANASHVLVARAYDATGNTGTSAGVTVHVDNTRPSGAFTAPAQNARLRGTVQLAATASDDTGVAQVRFQDGPVILIGSDSTAPYSVSWDTTKVSDGHHSIYLFVYDQASNPFLGTRDVYVDNMPPTSSITAPLQGTHLRGTVQVAAAATDQQGVARVEFYDGQTLLGMDTTAPYSVSWNTLSLAQGTHLLSTKVYDLAGNESASVAVPVTVDNTAPVAVLTSPAQGALVRGLVQVGADASDEQMIARVEFYDGQTLLGTDVTVPFGWSWDTSAVADGAHTLTAKAYDVAGNSQVSASSTVTVDNTLPSVAITSPQAGALLFLSATIQASASDNSGVTQVVFYDGATVIGTDTTAPYSVSWNVVFVPKGQHTLTARAYDAAGNVKTSSNVVVNVQ